MIHNILAAGTIACRNARAAMKQKKNVPAAHSRKNKNPGLCRIFVCALILGLPTFSKGSVAERRGLLQTSHAFPKY